MPIPGAVLSQEIAMTDSMPFKTVLGLIALSGLGYAIALTGLLLATGHLI